MILMLKDGGECLPHALTFVILLNLLETYLCLICLLNLTYCHENARAKLEEGQQRLLRSRNLARARQRLQGVGGSALARESVAMLGHWQRQVGVRFRPRLRPRAKMGGCNGRQLALRACSPGQRLGGKRSLLCLACLAACAGRSWEGGSGACFACVAWLALVGVCGVLVVVRWRGNRHQCCVIGSSSGARFARLTS
jgi:hypothetical protein